MNMKHQHITLTDDNFRREVLESAQPVLADFTADWCGPCHILAPIIEQVAEEFAGKIKIGKLDVDRNTRVTAQFNIRSLPTVLFFKNGKVVDQIVGAVAKDIIVNKLRDC